MMFQKTLIAVALASLVGCATFENADKRAKRVEEDAGDAASVVKSVQNRQQTPERATVVFHDGDWASLTPIEIKQREVRDTLKCRGERTTSYGPRSPVDILEFSQFMTNLCGIPVRVSPDAMTAVQTQSRLAMSAVPGAVPGVANGQMVPPIPAIGQPMQAGMPSVIGTGQFNQNMGFGGRVGLIDIKYTGDLPGLFDMVTSRLGLSWRYADGAVTIYYLDTKVFRVFSQPYNYDLQSVVQSGTTTAMGSGGSSSGSSGSSSGGISGSSGSQQTTTISMKASLWDGIDNTVKNMATPGVGRYAVNPTTGTVTVTDTPEALSRIEAYLNNENKSLSKQIVFNVKVLAVTLSNGGSMGIDWNLVYKSMGGKFGMSLANVTAKDQGSVSTTVSVLPTATGSVGQFAGSSIAISALEQQGRVSELLSPSVTTLNYRTVPVQIGSQTTYIAQSQTTQTAQVGSTTALTPGTVTTGFNMRLTPNVMPDNMILLDTAINVSALRQLRQLVSGGVTIEGPDLDNRIFSQTSRLRPGETLILSAFERLNESSNKAGVGNPNNILLGGSVKSSTTRDVVVILITPVLMD